MKKLPPRFRVIQEDTGAKNTFAFRVVCEDVDVTPWPFIARLQAYRTKLRGRVVYTVGGVAVAPRFQRQGLATRLYEEAALEACRRRGRLASTARNPGAFSNEFWEKQLRKGRADALLQKTGTLSRVAFVLKECPPKGADIDLSGLRNVRKRRMR
jgi:GNAT superfamily N-acetyltransferase